MDRTATTQTPTTPYTTINAIRNGVKFRDFEKITKNTGLTKDDWAKYLATSTKTLDRYKKAHKTFEAFQAERILQIDALFKKGEQIFGSNEGFLRWLNHESIALGGTRPKDMLDTSSGVGLVEDELGRIEYGVYA
jgi:putative toxin-antitoxin system antitoxin component (TIGR02293 family)